MRRKEIPSEFPTEIAGATRTAYRWCWKFRLHAFDIEGNRKGCRYLRHPSRVPDLSLRCPTLNWSSAFPRPSHFPGRGQPFWTFGSGGSTRPQFASPCLREMAFRRSYGRRTGPLLHPGTPVDQIAKPQNSSGGVQASRGALDRAFRDKLWSRIASRAAASVRRTQARLGTAHWETPLR